MTHYYFVINYSFSTTFEGVNGTFEGRESISDNDFEAMEKALATCMKVLLKKDCGCVKFETYNTDDYKYDGILSIYNDWMHRSIRWMPNTTQGISKEFETLNKADVKALFYEAIQGYRERRAIHEAERDALTA